MGSRAASEVFHLSGFEANQKAFSLPDECVDKSTDSTGAFHWRGSLLAWRNDPTFLYVLTVQLISPAGAEPEFVNLATKARITASSELEGQGLILFSLLGSSWSRRDWEDLTV